MKKIWLSLIIFILLWGLSFENEVIACSCMELPSVTLAKDEADAVFLGKVTTIEDVGIQREVTIEVHEAWKGIDTETIRIYTGYNSGDCGLPIAIGESYLFYATDRSEGENRFLTSTICSRTVSEANATDDLKELGLGKKEFTQTETSSPDVSQSRWTIPVISSAFVFVILIIWSFRKKQNRFKL
ncbi:hypothetical protein ABE021_12855 [Sporosarcina gallistercoris]|uniref:hypothetical protein n=1 Tax=Sporosarcina gallistercoris TaxID=2762245 RepID=UPI003D2A3BA9